MNLRGNLRELFKFKPRLLLKPQTLAPVIFLLVFFLAAGFFAITQETGGEENPGRAGFENDLLSPEGGEEGFEPEFIPASPPRWFRSNAGGMALEEIPSRLGALRNQYAMVIDYVAPDDLDPRLTPFSKDEYIIEIRILYKDRKETRKQWLLRDESGNTRVNAVFRAIQDEAEAVPADAGAEASSEAALSDGASYSAEDVYSAEGAYSEEDAISDGAAYSAEDAASDETAYSTEAAPSRSRASETKTPAGFIEVYNENGQISMDYSLFEDGSEILTAYFYNGSALIRAETKARDSDSVEYRKTHTDNYRYNRSYSLRSVERVFHEAPGLEPVRIVFPGRVLDAAYEKDFIKEKLTIVSDFIGSHLVDDGYRMVYDTDSRGRVLGETLYDGDNEVVWRIKNTWIGDRIASILKIEGEEEKLTEYDYDSSGNRIAQRDMRNGVLERQVLIDGAKETEELYMNGVMVLKALWEDGRKISEERVRRR